eukprot:3812029-Rhodomonas_salina.1
MCRYASYALCGTDLAYVPTRLLRSARVLTQRMVVQDFLTEVQDAHDWNVMEVRHRQTDTHRHTQTQTESDTQTHRQRDTHKHRHTARQTEKDKVAY